MAIYHLNTNHVSRKTGRSATASIAYRAGIEIKDERTGKTHDYANRSGVVTSKCFALQYGDEVELDRNKLWNKAEFAEKRKDGRTAREIIVNIPHELPEEEREKLVDDFAKHLADRYDCAVDYAIHLPDKEGDNRNHHAHILMTTRNIEFTQNNEIQLTDKTYFEWEDRKLSKHDKPKGSEQIKVLRENWADMTNERLKDNNLDVRIDHRSFKDQGLEDYIPTKKLGWKATQLERKGIRTEIGDYNRQAKANNAEIERIIDEIYDLSDKSFDEGIQNIYQKPSKLPTELRKEKSGTEVPSRQQKAENEPIKDANEHKSTYKEIKKDLQKFERFINKVAEDLHPNHLKQLEDKAKAFVMEVGRPAYEDLKEFEKQEPKEPINPFKKSQWKKDWQEWRNEYLEKLHAYKDVKQEHEGLKKNADELKKQGVSGSRGLALAGIKENMPELYEKYEKATDRLEELTKEVNRINTEQRLEQMQEKLNDRGFER